MAWPILDTPQPRSGPVAGRPAGFAPGGESRTPCRATCPKLVLGLGNILLSDEGVGVRVVEAMRELSLPPDVEVFDGGTAGFDLLDVVAGREKVIVIDAIAGEHEAGTVVRLGLEDLVANSAGAVSLHEVGFVEAVTLARRLGGGPKEVVVIGVQPQAVRLGLELSPLIRHRVPRIVELVFGELES